MTDTPFKRRLAVVVSGLCAFLMLVPVAAHADPDTDEQGIDSALSEAIDDYIEAEDALNTAEARQDDLNDSIKDTKDSIETLTSEVNDFAVAAYLNGGIPSTMSVLAVGDPTSAIDGLSTLSYLGDQSGAKLQELIDAQVTLEAEELALEDEIQAAADALADIRDARDAAAAAIAADGTGSSPGPQGGNARVPDAAPRNTDGSWPYESCSVPDPTTGGCITARTDHALKQAIMAGFDRYTKCYRSAEDGGEHPRGRACDFSVDVGGFVGYATGESKTYGDNLAYWFVQHADLLGVKYVIWFNEIWEPAAGGWRYYPGCGGGSPSCDHTDHVHLSML
ncbi:hypothetical protein FB566_1684 [Stackebrandtia endophytica]|uniref:ARB-07466-like C-terminal domain-containing protein n=1 Tax=Stackebrandtia endophytica TaxID=1496996 RepID=A0A543AUA1_9ACTN|nr:hypothetical protein [Stackebrandtia endophytica]TQL76163.1 hypothetical protein FB566_1684 [Stackebrandtia endophytica]